MVISYLPEEEEDAKDTSNGSQKQVAKPCESPAISGTSSSAGNS